MRGKSKSGLRALTVTYIVILLALAALAITRHFIAQREDRNQQTSNAVLRTASRQEALLERVSFLAYRLATARESSERQQCRERLSSTVNEMEASYRALLEGDPESKLPGNPPPSVRAIYFGSPFFLDHVVGYYNVLDRMKVWGKTGAFWDGLWGLLFGSAFFWIPGLGPLLVAGPLVSWFVGALQGAIVVGGLSTIGAGLYSLGIPKDSILRYETGAQDRQDCPDCPRLRG
jgi:hypothetical protein